MQKGWVGWVLWLPLPAFALDIEAISREIVAASPWGKNADILPMLFGWLGLVVVVALFVKLIYSAFDTWRSRCRAQAAARQSTDQWLLELGDMLKVSPPSDLKAKGTPAQWQQYRHKIKQALFNELQRGRQLSALVDELRSR